MKFTGPFGTSALKKSMDIINKNIDVIFFLEKLH